ncbi:PAS domain-containing protein [Scytonema sp. UIC 10036]|uniref:PAS domain-containing protein n=1 Tax=Scytonema sp. UIC 10036 TaxID=2304196 RepID=UPI0012DA3B49|nr:PAS domain-containing protein [Scytonema sp. UIC 10036]MUG93134.1 PAS domain-containing protein [Scytonema sp. UIC 10036]
MTTKRLDWSQEQREHIKQEMRRRIQQALEFAKDLSAEDCRNEIRSRLFAIQKYCKSVGKTFIVLEERITCDQFELGGSREEPATLFRGPNENASVAICVTDRGSLLYRNDSPWQIYKQRELLTRTVADIHTSDLALCHIALLAELQIRSNLVVSIVLENGGMGESSSQLWGLLVANYCFEPRQWEPLEINLLKQLGTQVSIAIQQAELYQKAQTELLERQRTEKLLQSTQNQLQHLLACSPAIIYSCEPSGDFGATFVSDNVFNILGYAPQEFTSHSHFWLTHIHPDDGNRVLAELAQLPHREHFAYEYRFLHKNGYYRWMYDEFRLVKDPQGNPIEIVGCWQDISDRVACVQRDRK